MKISKKEKDFIDIINLIKKAKEETFDYVNTQLIDLYWNIGRYINNKIKNSEWGKSVVKDLANYISNKFPDLKGYSDKNLWRMRQFYETYNNNEKLSPLVRQLSWSNNLLILSKTKDNKEKEFYIYLSIKERYSKRELERQIDSGIFERSILSNISKPSSISLPFKDTYVLDFLNLPENHSENDLKQGLINNLKHFVLEFGKDFAFLGQEYRISVGNHDYFIDLLFYHRELRCLIVIELKIDDFKPEYLGKLNFYLEALDRDVRKKHENPSVGIIICKSKDKEVVEYAMNKNLSKSLISEYKIKLIKKNVLRNKLNEFYSLYDKNQNKKNKK